jgi:hypothetical protein
MITPPMIALRRAYPIARGTKVAREPLKIRAAREIAMATCSIPIISPDVRLESTYLGFRRSDFIECGFWCAA